MGDLERNMHLLYNRYYIKIFLRQPILVLLLNITVFVVVLPPALNWLYQGHF